MTVGQLQYIVQAVAVGAAAVVPVLAVARGRGLGRGLRLLLAVCVTAGVTALLFGAVRAVGVTAEDRITLAHLGILAVVLVPGGLLIGWAVVADRAARRATRAVRQTRSP